MQTADRRIRELVSRPDRLLRIFNEELMPKLYPGRRLRAARPKRVSDERGPGFLILCRLEAEEELPGHGLPPLATLRLRGAEGSASPSGVPLPGLGLLVDFFPDDPWIPGLKEAADAARMAPLLERITNSDATSPPAAGWSCTPLRYHPAMRCALRYERSLPSATTRVFGKVFAKRKRALRAWDTLQALSRLRSPGGSWRSPRPLHLDAELHLVLMEWLPGEAMKDRLAEAASEAAAARLVRRAAQALWELHRPADPSWEPRTLEIDHQKLRRRVARVGAADAALAKQLVSLVDALGRRTRALPAPRETLLHGSASPNQLLVDGETLSIVDLDGVRRGDPAIDVGTFMASLRKCRVEDLGGRDPASLAERFLEEYRSLCPEDPELADRARAIACQELTNYAARGFLKRSSLLRPVPAAEDAQRLLTLAAGCLHDPSDRRGRR